MLKRVLMAGLAVGVGLATLQTGTAEAQWQFAQPPGMWWWYGTVDGCGSIARIPNPDTHPARLQCDITLTRIETLCVNPNDNDVRPGVAGSKVVVNNPFDKDEFVTAKKKGKANVCVGVNEAEDLGPAILCPNRNWNLISDDPSTTQIEVGALTTEFVASCTTQECTAKDSPDPCSTTVEKDTHVCQCTLKLKDELLGIPYTNEDAPAPCLDPLGVGCTAYSCVELDATTGTPTGQLCQIAQ